jgi:SAM-dependent methyltransferase
MTAIHQSAQQGFTVAAASYGRGRPGYPVDILGWLRTQIGLAPGKRALEVGAGTGKFTQYIAATGADVSVVEPVSAMRAQLLQDIPTARVISGSAESIDLEAGAVDAVLCAQSFHWFATRAVLGEFARVLKPHGVLGLVWNMPDERVPWVAALEAILKPLEDVSPYAYRRGIWREIFPHAEFSDLALAEYQHSHAGAPNDVIVERVLSLSYIANLPQEQRDEVMERIRQLVAAEPDLTGRSQIEFPYRTYAYHSRRS